MGPVTTSLLKSAAVRLLIFVSQITSTVHTFSTLFFFLLYFSPFIANISGSRAHVLGDNVGMPRSAFWKKLIWPQHWVLFGGLRWEGGLKESHAPTLRHRQEWGGVLLQKLQSQGGELVPSRKGRGFIYIEGQCLLPYFNHQNPTHDSSVPGSVFSSQNEPLPGIFHVLICLCADHFPHLLGTA